MILQRMKSELDWCEACWILCEAAQKGLNERQDKFMPIIGDWEQATIIKIRLERNWF